MDIQVVITEIVQEIIEKTIEKAEACSVVLDFSMNFKSKKKTKKIPEEDPINGGVIEIELPEVFEIPENLITSSEEIIDRKFLDTKRWYCMSRPQYSKSCGITSLVSCWNFLYSTLGYGKFPVLSQEKALIILGIEPPFHNISFGKFTGNNTLIYWFNTLNLNFGIKGKARVFWKLHGKNRTEGFGQEEAFEELKAGLKNTKKSYIYHCYNHYMCPIGYEIVSTVPSDAYKRMDHINNSDLQAFVIIGECSKAYPIFHIKRWNEIVMDINQQNPYYYNIRKPELGIQARTSEIFVSGKKLGKNLHCIIEFESQEN